MVSWTKSAEAIIDDMAKRAAARPQWDQYAAPEVPRGEHGVDHMGFWASLEGMTLDALIRTLESAKAQGMPGHSEVHVDRDYNGSERLLLRS